MTGDFLKQKIREAGYDLINVAERLGITAQALNSKLKSDDLKLSFIESVANSINKSVYFFIPKDTSFNEEPTSDYKTKKNLIPVYEEVGTIGGTSTVANMDPATHPSEWIDAGDWFPDATAAIRHYGDSMSEYPSGCILALKEVFDRSLIVWGRNYCIETSEYRVTKKIYDSGEFITARSSNEETYKDGALIHPSFTIPKKSISKMFQVLGYVVKEYSNGPVFIAK